MGKFRLSKAAKQDLINIANFGDAQFGIARSDKYREKLKQRFQSSRSPFFTQLSTTLERAIGAACVA